MTLRVFLPVVALLSLPLQGCLVIRDNGKTALRPGKAPKECRPSQYWDGNQCRHKGKGKGARKHDN